MKIERLNLTGWGDAFYRTYLHYIDELNAIIRQYGNPWIRPQPWWVDDPDSLVTVALADAGIAGFVINGWGRRVDADTDSEILEFYVAPTFRRTGLGRQLARLGFAQLRGRAGLQVYFDNKRAATFWNTVLNENNLAYTTYSAIENNIPVIKYRLVEQPQNPRR